MNLREIQSTLAHLYTDRSFRNQMCSNSHHDFFKRRKKQIGKNSTDIFTKQIESFALSLHRKRFNEICRLLPKSTRAIGARFSTLFFEYADQHHSSGEQKHLNDALCFCRFLQTRIHPREADLVSYEAAWLQASDLSKIFLIRFFSNDPRTLWRNFTLKIPPKKSVRHRFMAIWIRLTPKFCIHQFSIRLW